MTEFFKGGWALVRKIFAISSMVQGFTWFVLTVTCITIYYLGKTKAMTHFESTMIYEETQFIDMISFGFYTTLLNRNSTENDRVLLPPRFHIFAWIYAMLSLLWFVFATYEAVVLFKIDSQKYATHNLLALSLVTLVVSVLDAILFSLAMNDFYSYNIFNYHLPDLYKTDDFQTRIDLQYRYVVSRKLSFGILATLAARGYVLWLMNCTAGFVSLVMSIKIFQLPPILQYSDTIPRPKMQRTRLISDSITSTSSVAIPMSPEYDKIGTGTNQPERGPTESRNKHPYARNRLYSNRSM